MKLSQLLPREDFYKIILKTVTSNDFFKDKAEKGTVTFLTYKYLNIIIHKSLDNSVKNKLVFEYSLSKSRLKQLLQSVYLRIIFLPFITNFFSDKKILLPSYLKNFGVVPGNHRIRLFEPELKKIVVLLKHNESEKFIINDIKTRTNNDLSYAPKIISFGTDWLFEEFINGVPFNRVETINSKKALKNLIEVHYKELVNKNKTTIKIGQYLNNYKKELKSLVGIIEDNNPTKKDLIFAIDELVSIVLLEDIEEIETSITHGDFQEGNVRINSKNEVFVIDWESSDIRFFLYDVFVILSSIRTGIKLEKAFELFFQNTEEFKININGYSKNTIIKLFCLEEFRFNLNEDISKNFYISAKNSLVNFKYIHNFISKLKIEENE